MPQTIRYNDSKPRYFYDSEFYEDGSTIDLISLAFVCADGREYYAVNSEARLDRVSPWLREHVLPQLPSYSDPAWKTRGEIVKDLLKFIPAEEGTPEFWAYFADYDWIVLCQLFGTMMGLPKHFPRFCMDLKQLSVELDAPKFPKQESGAHNALADARWNAEHYKFLRKLP